MLTQKFAENLGAIVLPRADWTPYPTIEDREAWSTLLPSLSAAQLEIGEELLNCKWPSLPATLFLQYTRKGNRRNYEMSHFQRRAMLTNLVVAECIEAQSRFLDDIVNGIWTICEESYWGVPAHVGVQEAGNGLPDTAEPTVDLFAAETANLLSWTHYLLGERLDTVSPLVRPRIVREIQTKFLTPNFERINFWWMGFIDMRNGRRVNNWNPWICSNWMASLLLIEEDAERRIASLAKAMRALDHFIDPYPRDGGCDEGPSYWGKAGASLFDCLELLHSATGGQLDVYGDDLIQQIGRFIYRVHIDEEYYINFADAPALVRPDALLVYRYGQRIGDEAMMDMGRWLAQEQGLTDSGIGSVHKEKSDVPTNLFRVLPTLFTLSELANETQQAHYVPAKSPMPRDVWLDEIEVMVARDQARTADGFYVAAKGGHNDESHNHNDIGNFVVYVDGKPLLVDAGVETYTAKTFDMRYRYKIWTMQSAYHSLPTIGSVTDGVMQLPGANFKASNISYQADDDHATLSLDIATAYPSEASLNTWQRSVKLERGKQVIVTERYELAESAPELTLSLVTPCAVDTSQPGVIALHEREFLPERVSAVGQVQYDAAKMTVSTDTIPITDERLGGTWGESLTRIVLHVVEPPKQDEWVLTVTR